MPRRKINPSRTRSDFRSCLPYLRQIGVDVGINTNSSAPQSERFSLQQIDRAFARVFVLPGNEVIAILPAKLLVREHGLMITKSDVIPSWDEDWKLDLDDLASNAPLLEELTRQLPKFPSRSLNRFLVGRAAPLGPCQPEGILTAVGNSVIPERLHDESCVTLQVWLQDERGEQSCHDFAAHVDRSMIAKRERALLEGCHRDLEGTSGLWEKIVPEEPLY